MANNQSSFTNRMLRRASNRVNYYSAETVDSNDHFRRKYNILCAIDDKSGQQRNDGNSKAPTNPQSNVKTMKIETEGNNESIITSLSATIDDLDVQIATLGIQEAPALNTQEVMKMCSRIYPILADIKFDATEHFDNKNNKSKHKLINKSPGDMYKTPMKPPRRCGKPNLESTRKASPKHKKKSNSKTNSPQIECTISTIPLLESPMTQEEKAACLNTTPDVPDEVERFLENALGNELFNSTMTYGDIQDVSNSHLNASELMSETQTPLYKKISKILSRYGGATRRDDSVLPPARDTKILDKTFDRTTKLYRSLSQRIKKKLRTAMIRGRPTDNPSALVPDYSQYPKDGSKGEKIENLLTQVRVQQSIMNQASKALELCQSKKEFIASTEEVESQRLLLLADLRKRALLEKLKCLSCVGDQNGFEVENQVNKCAKISIGNIRLTLRKCLYREPEPGEIQEWFVAVIIEGTNVWASSAVSCPIDSLTLDFPGFGCVMDNLTPNLKVVVEIYVLKLTTGITYNHEVKYHIDEEKENATCPSPKKLLKKVERPLSPKTRRPIILSSSFTLSGYVELFLRDLTLTSPWPLEAVPLDSLLLGTIDLDLNCNLHFAIDNQGFVNQGDVSGGFAIWNRRWCVLKGNTIMFWNYPRDQENKMPLMIIDLMHCICEQICPVNRSLCAKPRTLLIETIRAKNPTDRDSLMMECHESYTIVKHLLSFDSTRELVDWMSKLNHVLSLLREWNVTNTIRINTPSSAPMVSEL